MFLSPGGQFAEGKLLSNEHMHLVTYDSSNDDPTAIEAEVTFDYLVRTTEGFNALPVSKRKCYFPREKELKHFPIFSEANCMLECSWNVAAKHCRCVPWFLKKKMMDFKMCDKFGNICFKDVVDKRYNGTNSLCHSECLDDCETLEFKIATIPHKARTIDLTAKCYEYIADEDLLCRQLRWKQNYTESLFGIANLRQGH